MALIESHWIEGVKCDVRDCTAEHRLPELIPAFGKRYDAFEAQVYASGWSRRLGRSARWYCPNHVDRARRCPGKRYGVCSHHCPEHNGGRVWGGAAR